MNRAEISQPISQVLIAEREAEASFVLYKQTALDSMSKYLAIYEIWQKTLIELQVTYAGLRQTRETNNTLLNGRVQLLEQDLAKLQSIENEAKLFPEALDHIQEDASKSPNSSHQHFINNGLIAGIALHLIVDNFFSRVISEIKRVNLDSFNWNGLFNQEPLASIVVADPFIEYAFLLPENNMDQFVSILEQISTQNLSRQQIHQLALSSLTTLQIECVILENSCINLRKEIDDLLIEKQNLLNRVKDLNEEIYHLKNKCKQWAVFETALRLIQRLHRHCTLRAVVPNFYNLSVLQKMIVKIKVLREASQFTQESVNEQGLLCTNQFDLNDRTYPPRTSDMLTRIVIPALQHSYGFS